MTESPASHPLLEGRILEVAVSRIWSSVLQHPQVGSDEDFFYLGGDSIQLMHVIAKVKEQFGVSIPFAVALENRTVCGLSRQIRLLRDVECAAE